MKIIFFTLKLLRPPRRPFDPRNKPGEPQNQNAENTVTETVRAHHFNHLHIRRIKRQQRIPAPIKLRQNYTNVVMSKCRRGVCLFFGKNLTFTKHRPQEVPRQGKVRQFPHPRRCSENPYLRVPHTYLYTNTRNCLRQS